MRRSWRLLRTDCRARRNRRIATGEQGCGAARHHAIPLTASALPRAMPQYAVSISSAGGNRKAGGGAAGAALAGPRTRRRRARLRRSAEAAADAISGRGKTGSSPFHPHARRARSRLTISASGTYKVRLLLTKLGGPVELVEKGILGRDAPTECCRRTRPAAPRARDERASSCPIERHPPTWPKSRPSAVTGSSARVSSSGCPSSSTARAKHRDRRFWMTTPGDDERRAALPRSSVSATPRST